MFLPNFWLDPWNIPKVKKALKILTFGDKNSESQGLKSRILGIKIPKAKIPKSQKIPNPGDLLKIPEVFRTQFSNPDPREFSIQPKV